MRKSKDKENGSTGCDNIQPNLFDKDVIAHAPAEGAYCAKSRRKSRRRRRKMQNLENRKSGKEPRIWSLYNLSQTQEKIWFCKLLADLCSQIVEPPYKMGRPTASLRDIIFCLTFKVYEMRSGRRVDSDIKDIHSKGFIDRPPSYNSLFTYSQSEIVSELLDDLIEATTLPFKEIETSVPVDSTGFSTSQHDQWLKERKKFRKTDSWRQWLKLHAMVGAKTGIILSYKITERHDHDSQEFDLMFNNLLGRGFKINKIMADKAYSTRHILQLVRGNNIKPFIPFKSNAKFSLHDSTWNMLLREFIDEQGKFNEEYHVRSNVEAVFSAMKRRFGGRIRSRTREAQINEIKQLVLAYNICVIIQCMYQLKLEPNFKTPSTL